jgi:hypothetical protein
MALQGGKSVKLFIKNSSNAWIPWDGILETGDIAIGAVEIKDSDSDDRQTVNSGGAAVVGGLTKIVTLDPTVDTSAYAAGDLVCEKLTITGAASFSGGTGIIQSVIVGDQAAQEAELDLIFFDSDPTGTTFTENAAFDIADADLDRICAIVTVIGADYKSFADNSCAFLGNIGQAFTAVGTANLFLAVVTRGTPTYAAAGDIRIRVNILQD